MQIIRETLKVVTDQKQQFLDLTKQVRDVLKRHSVRDGILLLNTLHTTTALFINEVQPALLADLKNLMARLVRERDGYFHNDPHYSDCDRGNATAHLRATLFGNNVALGVSDGELVLGQHQGIIFAELDGPRERTLELQVLGA